MYLQRYGDLYKNIDNSTAYLSQINCHAAKSIFVAAKNRCN